MTNWDTSAGTRVQQDQNPPWAALPPWPPQPVPGSPGGPQVNEPLPWSYGFTASGQATASYSGIVTVGSGANNQVATLADIEAATTGVASFNGRTGIVELDISDIMEAGGAPIDGPAFGGSPTAATQPAGTSNTTLATTAFVAQALANQPGVYSWNGRTGAVTLTLSDVTGAGGAPAASPNLTGVPTGPTASLGTNTQQLATCSFVMNAFGNSVTSWNGRIGPVTMTLSDITTAGGAPLNGPTFTGVASASTAAPGTATTQIATTAFVMNAVSAATAGVASFNTRTGNVTLQAADISGAGGALLAGPAFTGTPTAPTPVAGSDNNDIATTAFVQTALAGASVVSSFNGRTGAITLSGGDVATAGALMTAGGTMTGAITLPGNAATALQAVPLQQVTAAVATALPLAGGTMTGPVTLAGNATANLQPTTLQQQTAAIAAAVAPYIPQNYIDNSSFAVSQRNLYGTTLAAGAYGMDRWKAGAAGCTFTLGSGSVAGSVANTIVISAGSLQQVVMGAQLLTAAYTLSWQGTAQGRIAGTSGGGTYAASPIQFAATANSNVFVEFNTGTVWAVQLQLGNVATPWQPLTLEAENARCQRFLQILGYNFGGYAGTTAITFWDLRWFPELMRAAPTITNNETSATGFSTRSVTGNTNSALWSGAVSGAYQWAGTITASAEP